VPHDGFGSFFDRRSCRDDAVCQNQHSGNCALLRIEPIRAVIVSDVLLYRDGIAAGLARIGGFAIRHVCGIAQSQARLDQAHLDQACIDVVFLDMSRPEALRLPPLLAGAVGATPIVGFGVGSHDEAIACAEAGITAFVGAEGTIEDLAEAAFLALEGKVVCSPALTARLVQRLAELADGAPASANLLTRREQQIATLVEDGLTNKEIAGTLRISPATVKNHVHMILEKLNVTRRNAIGRHSETGVGYRSKPYPIASSAGAR
jgi:two-component system, NarL family, nitrate/nitrite response regulator NarL